MDKPGPTIVLPVHRTHLRIPGARYRRASRIDLQINFCRYHREIHLGERPIVEGFGVTKINAAGKVVKVIGFFGILDRGG